MASQLELDPTNVYCKDHPDAPLVEDYGAGNQICSACGLVVGDRVIEVGPEWRRFPGDENAAPAADPSRVGGPPANPLLNGSDLTTIIGGGNGAAAFDGVAKYQNRQSISSGLINACKEIYQMTDRLRVPRAVAETASNLFKKMHDGKHIKGRPNDNIAAACMYIACGQEGVQHTFKEVCAVSNISKKEMGRCYKLILKTLAISSDVTRTGDIMSRFCCNLGLPYVVQKAAKAIAKAAEDLGIVSGRWPITVAAAAIFMASQASEEKRSQKEVCDATGISVYTLRKSYKLMLPRAEELFPKDFEFFTPIDQLPQS